MGRETCKSPSVLLESVEELGFSMEGPGQEPLKGFEQRHDMSLVFLEII